MRAFLNWLLSLFGSKTKTESRIEKRIKDGEKKIKEIENEDISDDDITDYLNK